VTPDVVVRRALWATAVFNLLGALMFAFPASLPGRLTGLPADVPVIYRAMVALFIVLFAGMYAWLARAAVIDRPMVAFAAIGKASAFGMVALLWRVGLAAGMGVVALSGDLAFATVFAWWLWAGPRGGVVAA
jgi:hypothetical protein